jgi:hypothetical protein
MPRTTALSRRAPVHYRTTAAGAGNRCSADAQRAFPGRSDDGSRQHPHNPAARSTGAGTWLDAVRSRSQVGKTRRMVIDPSPARPVTEATGRAQGDQAPLSGTDASCSGTAEEGSRIRLDQQPPGLSASSSRTGCRPPPRVPLRLGCCRASGARPAVSQVHPGGLRVVTIVAAYDSRRGGHRERHRSIGCGDLVS